MPKKLRALHRGTALTRSERKELGPIQIVVIRFDDLKLENKILAELRRLSELEVVRLVDTVIVAKSKSGELVRVEASDPTQETSHPGVAATLIGLEEAAEESEGVAATVEARGFVGDERTWSVADVIPTDAMAVVALLEHRWAIPVRDAVHEAGGETVADAWVHPDDLAAYAAVSAIDQRSHKKTRR
jgi:hypothetical protein